MVARPQTAATTTLKDETRIMNKLKLLEKIEQRIEEDLEQFISRRGDKVKKDKKGVYVTKKMLLEASNCDKLEEINTVILRDKNIGVFDQPMLGIPGYFKMEDLINLECIYASHNLLKDVYGIGQLLTLRELNLSFNMISDITPLGELTLLEKLYLNRNQISIIDAIKNLTSLNTLALFHNEIFNAQKALEIFAYLGINYKLRDISIDGNPISSTTKFKYQLIISIPKLQVLDDERIQELDHDLAEQYFEVHNIPVPEFAKIAGR